MKKQFIIWFFLIFCCVVCKIAIGEQKNNRIIRQEDWILVVQDESGHLGYYDIKSGFYQEPVYTSIFDNPDYDAPLLAERDGLWGYINRTTGEEIIPFQFTAIGAYSDFANGYAVIGYSMKTNEQSVRNHFILIDTYGNQIALPNEYSIASGVCGEKKSIIIYGRCNNYYGYGIYQIDKGVVLEPTYENIWFGDCDFFCFRDASEMIGIINADGNVVLEPMYYTNGAPIPYLSHNNGTSSLRIDGYYKVYNEQGNPVYIFIDSTCNCFTIFDVNHY